MTEAILNPTTDSSLKRFVKNPSHAVMLTGLRGAGKGYVAKYMAAELLMLPFEKLNSYPYLVIICPDGNSTTIEQVRDAQKLLSLKVPGSQQIRRLVIFEDAQTMTVEAQNALLKSLEEPPTDTVIVLTATEDAALLPTILSRVQKIAVLLVTDTQLSSVSSDLRKVLLADGRPGLLHALEADEEHSLVTQIASSKDFLTKPAFERLVMINALKERDDVAVFVQALLIVCKTSMKSSAVKNDSKQARAWQKRTKQLHNAEKQLRQNASVKLLLTDLALGL